MRKYVLIVLIALTIVGCTRKLDDGIQISGTISGTEVRIVSLFELGVSDSKELDVKKLPTNGKFSFEITATEEGLYFLSADNGDFIVLILQPGDNVKVAAEGWNISQTYSVEGSPESELLAEYRKGYYLNLNKMAELNRTLFQSQSEDNYAEVHAVVSKELEDLFQAQYELARSFITNNSTSMASLLVLNDKFGTRYLFSDIKDLDLLEIVDKGLMKSYPGNKHAIAHHQRVLSLVEKANSTVEIVVGSEAPDICMVDVNGSKSCLTDFRGKVVLIDFWASWCVPCRKTNPGMVEIYKEYKEKGFEIYGISLDTNQENWRKAIEDDGITWKQVSDMKGNSSPVVQLYKISKIPTTLLLSRDGKILEIDPDHKRLLELLDEKL